MNCSDFANSREAMRIEFGKVCCAGNMLEVTQFDGKTPVAVIRRGTLPDQQTLLATLETLPERIAASEIKPPALIVVGSVVALHEQLSWFEQAA